MPQVKYQGIRPAPGYPTQPDHTEKPTMWKLLDAAKQTGIELTDSHAMLPASSVSAVVLANPCAQYFQVSTACAFGDRCQSSILPVVSPSKRAFISTSFLRQHPCPHPCPRCAGGPCVQGPDRRLCCAQKDAREGRREVARPVPRVRRQRLGGQSCAAAWLRRAGPRRERFWLPTTSLQVRSWPLRPQGAYCWRAPVSTLCSSHPGSLLVSAGPRWTRAGPSPSSRNSCHYHSPARMSYIVTVSTYPSSCLSSHVFFSVNCMSRSK